MFFKKIFIYTSSAFFLFLPIIVFAQPTFTDFRSVSEHVVDILNQVIVVLIGIGVLVFIYGVLTYVGAGDDTEKLKKAKNFILFGIIGLFVMVSVWGLVAIITNTLSLDNSSLPTPRNIPIN